MPHHRASVKENSAPRSTAGRYAMYMGRYPGIRWPVEFGDLESPYCSNASADGILLTYFAGQAAE